MIMGVLATLSILAILPERVTNINVIAAFGLVHMMAFSFIDVLVDSIMVNEAKKDPLRGSEDLQSLAFATHSVSGILSALVGAFFT